MPLSAPAKNEGLFLPEDLDLLQRIFDQACADRLLVPDSEEGKTLAKFIVGLFQHGIVSETELARAVADGRREA